MIGRLFFEFAPRKYVFHPHPRRPLIFRRHTHTQVIAVIEELGKRRGLAIALSNRDEESLDAVLSFTTRFVDDPRYTPHLIGVAHALCDIYGSLRGQSSAVDELFARLREKVASECAVQKMLLRLLGQIDYVMTTAEILAAEEREG